MNTNTQTAHTPGPWVAEYAGVSAPASKYFICSPANRADARLISAAPELLEACNAALRQVQRALNGDRVDSDFIEAEQKARAAIAKATEGQK